MREGEREGDMEIEREKGSETDRETIIRNEKWRKRRNGRRKEEEREGRGREVEKDQTI